MPRPLSIRLVLLLCVLQPICQVANACTGITLIARDGAVIVSRTNEWGLGDMDLKIGIFPQGHQYQALTPEGQYGFVSMTAYGQPYGPDGMNEVGLSVGMYYLPGYAEYMPYLPQEADRTLSPGDLLQWMLSSFSTVREVRAAIDGVRVVNVDDPRFDGAPLPFHWKVTDASGESLVLEYVKGGQLELHEPILGVITNSPPYDWHVTNLSNYLKLSPTPAPSAAIGERTLQPLGAGSGMLGLPGDFTPASRFVRAAAFAATVRPLEDADDAVSESFRILDSFNIPLGSVLPAEVIPDGLEGSTQITSASDLKNRVYYYHTQFNRRIRAIDLKAIDFKTVPLTFVSADPVRAQDIEQVRIGDEGK